METEGINLAQSDWTPDAVAAHFAEISDMSKAKALQGAFEQTQKYVGAGRGEGGDQVVETVVIPGRCEASNPESADSTIARISRSGARTIPE